MKRLSLLIIISSMLSHSTTSAKTFTVTKTTDTYPLGVEGELRWAIQQNNKTRSSKPHKIKFNIEGEGPFVIEPTQDLDPITRSVVIDGYSQPGTNTNTLDTGNNATLLIVISGKRYKTGNSYLGTGNGLTIKGQGAKDSVIKGLVINNWINTGILITDTNDINIVGNFIGTNHLGTVEQANQAGIFVRSSNTVIIGEDRKQDRNIIAGSFFYFNGSACIAAYDTREIGIINNYIGLNKDGHEILGNSLVGVECVDCNLAVVGLNAIAGHSIINISMIDVGNAYIVNNYVGIDAQASELFESNIGISIVGSGTSFTEMESEIQSAIYGNLIGGQNTGIKVGSQYYPSSRINGVVENLLGMNVTGIVLCDDNNVVAGNVMEENTGNILVYGSSTNNTISNNNISGGNFGIQIGIGGDLGKASDDIIQDNNLATDVGINVLCRPS